MAQAAEPPSGTRDFLADDVRRRRAAFDTIAAVFERYGFDPLEAPAFERLEVFAGKLGDEASSLIFKILKRGVHEASGEADLHSPRGPAEVGAAGPRGWVYIVKRTRLTTADGGRSVLHCRLRPGQP